MRVRGGDILVADGAMGTLLFERGLEPGACPETFNLDHPDLLEEIATLYLEAGADIIQTNTFGGSPLKLATYGLQERAAEINRSAVAAVKKAIGGRAYMSGSCGPTGMMLKPYGDGDPGEVAVSFVQQTMALVDAGVDVLCIETMTDLTEAVLAVEAARVATNAADRTIPVMATMTFDKIPRGFFTIMGVDIPTAARALEKSGVDIIGSNCGNGIENMIEIAREFRAHTDLPIIIQSNAGLPRPQGDGVIYPETPEFMAEKAVELVEAGVSIIGGCCGTTPDHIRAIRSAVDAAQPRDESRNESLGDAGGGTP